jgi:Xaa-Pro dipeptidase
MTEAGIEAIYLEGGTGMFYFTGVRWGNSERMFAVVLPARGELAWICPAFEEDRARELIHFGDDIRTWEEHESPYKRVAQVLADRGIRSGRIGIEERVRFFLYDGSRKAAPHLEYVSADPVTIECRVIKSPAELALMQKAADITIEAYKGSVAMLEVGMTRSDFRAISGRAHAALGVSGGIGAQIAEASANPHGSIKRIELKEGDIVLMDGGCGVDGYRSDISRTIVFGEPTSRQREMWNLMKKAQSAAFAKAGVGVPCEDVDAAARQVYINYGFGPGYQVPGLPHRTGHGIGLDGHEWINLVKGNTRPMEVGMCFSNEPMVVLPGEFGVRLEDCIYITEEGQRYFSEPSPAIDQPFA